MELPFVHQDHHPCRRIHEYVNDRLPIYDTNNDGKVTFEEYQDRQYGTIEGEVD